MIIVLILLLVGLFCNVIHLATRVDASLLPSRNFRNAAKEAYVAHLENELEDTRRQLYTSQNTCTTLRKRVDDQRKETLRFMSSPAAIAAANTSVEKLDDDDDDSGQLIQQKKEIERLQMKLQKETQQFREQVEKLTLMEAEIKEIKKMKAQSNDMQAKNKEIEQKLEKSQQKQREYESEIQLLALKLEAAEFAAHQHRIEKDGKQNPSIISRSDELLQSVCKKYSTILLTLAKNGEDDDYQKDIESEMEQSIKSALQTNLIALEKEWETRYSEVETKLNTMSDHVESLENQRDAALSKLETTASYSSYEKQLKEELSLELTKSLTKEITEQLTAELKETLSKKIERRYKKKYKKIQEDLKKQKIVSGQIHSNREQRRNKEEEIFAIREKCELEYKTQLIELQSQVQTEKERMRKLVRALVQREANKKLETRATRASNTNNGVKKNEKEVTNASDDNNFDELIQSTDVSSRRKKKEPTKGVSRPSTF